MLALEHRVSVGPLDDMSMDLIEHIMEYSWNINGILMGYIYISCFHSLSSGKHEPSSLDSHLMDIFRGNCVPMRVFYNHISGFPVSFPLSHSGYGSISAKDMTT